MSAEPPPPAAPVPYPAALAELAGLRVETPTAPVARTAPVSPNRLLGLAAGQRPRERALSLGVAALDDLELTALILRSGTSGLDVLTLAERLLTEAGSLHALARWRELDFRRLKGIGKVKAVQLCTVFEITRRVLSAERSLAPELSDPESIYAYLRPRAFGLEVEKCWVLTLNSRNRLLRCAELTSGTANQTLVRTAEVLREAGSPSRPVLLICRSGNRSVEAAAALEAAGFTDVTNVVDGFEGPLDENDHRGTKSGWRHDGLPWQQM
jgi:DNA repair protein RadC